MNYIKNVIFGMILGISNVIPGVSGGTMAVILNIYDKILFAVSLKNIKKNLVFLSTLAIGAILGIFLFSKIMLVVYSEFQVFMSFCFMGLIIGSLPMIYKRARYEKIKYKNVFIFIFTFILMVALYYFIQDEFANKSLSELGGLSPSIWIWLFLSAAVSGMAMILPGISGSFIMLVLGAYTITIEAISQLNLLTLLPILSGMLVGILGGIKIIKKMLRFHPQALYFAILGLILGSLFYIFPGFPKGTSSLIASLCLMAFFAIITYIFSKKT